MQSGGLLYVTFRVTDYPSVYTLLMLRRCEYAYMLFQSAASVLFLLAYIFRIVSYACGIPLDFYVARLRSYQYFNALNAKTNLMFPGSKSSTPNLVLMLPGSMFNVARPNVSGAPEFMSPWATSQLQ